MNGAVGVFGHKHVGHVMPGGLLAGPTRPKLSDGVEPYHSAQAEIGDVVYCVGH